jgi:hypothetical protein
LKTFVIRVSFVVGSAQSVGNGVRREIRDGIRGLVERVSPTTLARYRAFRQRRRCREADNSESRIQAFERAFRTGVWTSTGESLSGAGSSLAYTENLRLALPGLLRDLSVRTLLDVPCGDWNWMSHVDLPVERYIGGDLVPAIVEENEARFASARNEFLVIDLCADPLPAADLLLCRDALVHFSYGDIWRAIANILDADITYFATTTFHLTRKNVDLVTGIQWRHLNLEAAPFQFPAPLLSLREGSIERRLSVWKVSDLRDALPIPLEPTRQPMSSN